MTDDISYKDLNLGVALRLVTDDEADVELVRTLGMRVASVRSQMDRFREWCDRADALYYAETFTTWGADLWADHPDVNVPGRSHVSVNTPQTYVDVPASLQATEPIENMLATENTPEAREAAAAMERVRVAWKAEEKYELKRHKAATVKGLYGRTAGKVYWDKAKKRPCVELVEQPRNLFMGWKTDAYDELEWVAYVSRYEPNALTEEFGVDVSARDYEGSVVPYVNTFVEDARPSREWLNFGEARIEVWDYWYRRPVWKKGKFVRMDTYNVVIAGNAVVQGPTLYSEYDGDLPYVPLFNTFIPGVPDGRSELYDMEPLIREKFERITSGSQMIASGVAGDYWQLVGPEAPARVPAHIKPVRNTVVAPGAGNRIETITPFIAQFQLEQYLGRLDREMAVVSGLNDLLLGLAPSQVLSSSKAINALIANYESRLSMRRHLFYAWDLDLWNLTVKVWEKKDKDIREIVAAGSGSLDIRNPSLSPRDEQETALRAANLVNAKLISQRTGMDMVGVDDPETEQDLIREERTDATMFAADVAVMAQLLSTLQSLGLQAPADVQGQASAQLASGQNDLRTALGASTPDGSPMMQSPDEQGMMPPEGMSGPGVPEGPFAQAPAGAPQSSAQLQGMVTDDGKMKSRIMTKRDLGRR